MIPASFIQEWTSKAPWPSPLQVEQDLIISRALCDLFNSPTLAGRIAFRGGTAIHKLLFAEPLRYSEDIDLVQARPEPIGATADAIRDALSWLGTCKREQAAHSMRFIFRCAPEGQPDTTLKLKVELNTREHDSLYGIARYPFRVATGWYRADTTILSFTPEELFATKLRALLQRRKSRDLFDLHVGLQQLALDPDRMLTAFDHYLALEGNPITRAIAEQRMLEKLTRSLSVLIRQHGIGRKEGETPAKLLTAFLRKADEGMLGRVLIETAILQSMQTATDSACILREAAQQYKVDVDAVTAKVRQEFAAKEKSKPAAKAASAKAKPARKSTAA